MNGIGLFLFLLGIYLAGLVSIGWYFNQKQLSVTDFWLAGRSIGPAATGFSAAASWLTAGGILAVIGFYMLSGMGSIWGFVAPNVLALLIISVLVKKIKNLPAITQPELLEQRYSSAMRAPVAGIITIVMILFAVADIKGFAFLLQVFYGLSPVYAAVIVAVAVSVYVTLGGFSAVVWTDMVQFLFLATFTLTLAGITATAAITGGEGIAAGMSFTDLLSHVPAWWWNPLSIGIPMVLVFVLAIIPGWISEQDPWQRVWAARDEPSARRGMILGSFLVVVVFGACAVIAISLNALYPAIAEKGFPMGMAEAEPALLNFIVEGGFSHLGIALCAIGLAAAAMSCADTFAASGASCISRDLFQRYLKPDATMGEMMAVNRVSVLIIVLAATAGSFLINSIIDAIHIATFIASASYFFPLMGGLFWKRATRQGAIAALIVGAVSQIALVLVDLINTSPMAPPFLETLHPVFMGHGVIVGMALSGLAFIGVSLLTPAPSTVKLAPFFKDEAEKLAQLDANTVDETHPDYLEFIEGVHAISRGARVRLHMRMLISRPLEWKSAVQALTEANSTWVAPSGRDAVYRLSRSDLLACIRLTRGQDEMEIWFEAEPLQSDVSDQKKQMYIAFNEVSGILDELGICLENPAREVLAAA